MQKSKFIRKDFPSIMLLTVLSINVLMFILSTYLSGFVESFNYLVNAFWCLITYYLLGIIAEKTSEVIELRGKIENHNQEIEKIERDVHEFKKSMRI